MTQNDKAEKEHQKIAPAFIANSFAEKGISNTENTGSAVQFVERLILHLELRKGRWYSCFSQLLIKEAMSRFSGAYCVMILLF